MTDEASPQALVARFLRSNNYDQTLAAFLAEARLPADTGAHASADALTIERVLDEKRVFDLSQRFEKIALPASETGWSSPSPSVPHIVASLPDASNILNVSVETVGAEPLLLVSTAARGLHALHVTPPFERTPPALPAGDSPTLAWALLARRFLVTGSMSGRVALLDLRARALCDARTDHAKYVVRVAACEDADGRGAWVATAGWDARVLLYRVALPSTTSPSSSDGDNGSSAKPRLGAPVGSTRLPTNPEALLFAPRPELPQPLLVVSRRDSTFLYFHGVPALAPLGAQNLAPHANAWIAFSPAALALHPTDTSRVAVATSHTPHMKVIVARLLLPPPPPASSASDGNSGGGGHEGGGDGKGEEEGGGVPALVPAPPSSLARQNAEDAALQLQVSARAPQTGWSTPALAWRPSGGGVWVNGDDGAVRGVDVATGRVAAVLRGGHEAGSKVRCLWAGSVRSGGGDKGEEWVVSGGFDRRLVVWRCG